MTFDEFVGEVQNRARFGSMGDAVRSIRCTLGVLSQRLKGGEAKDLASQLPEEIGYYLMHSEAGQGQDFGADEFLDRVSSCEGEDRPDATYHARVVLEVLREAISPGQLRHVLEQFPNEYHPLFQAGSQGDLRMKARRRAARRTQARARSTTPKPRAMAQRTTTWRGRVVEIEPASEIEPRSRRIGRRAAGAWHLGR